MLVLDERVLFIDVFCLANEFLSALFHAVRTKMYNLSQEKKREMVASAFGEDKSGGGQTRLTVDDLNYLFMV